MTGAAFVGIGTGRCGTVSLARIVGACANTHVTHENPAVRSPWASTDESAVQAFVDHVRWARSAEMTVGDVALYWLPHIERLRERLPDLRVISLRRERTATVDSLTRKCPGYTLVRPQDRHHNPEWWDLAPSIDAPSIAEAWGRYYDYYYEQASALPGVLHVATEALDQDDTVSEIFDFLEIPDSDRVFLPERRHNTGSETVVALSRLIG